MARFVMIIVCVVLFGCVAVSDASDSLVDQVAVDPKDIEIINDLDMLQNWDDLQNEQALDNNIMDGQTTTGVSHDQ